MPGPRDPGGTAGRPQSDPRLGPLEAALRGAGEVALGHFGKVRAERKRDRSLVTEADRAVERYLVERLAAIEPGARLLGEEGTHERAAPGAAPTWAIDPIDGTAVFVAGLPTWSISVGLVRDGVPELGGVYLPASGELFLAGACGPLLWNGVAVDRRGEPGALAGPGPVDPEAWIALPSNGHRRYRVSFGAKTRSLGSTAAHCAWVARGAAAGAVTSGRLWDFAGGLACCRAAGAAWQYLSGAPVDLVALLEGEATPEPIVTAMPDDLVGVRRAVELVPRRPAGAPGQGPRPRGVC